MFPAAVLRNVFNNRAEEESLDLRGRKKLNNTELHNLCTSPNIIKVTKSRLMRWATHAADSGKMRNAYRISVRKHEERDLRDLDIDGIIIKSILKEWDRPISVWTGFIWLRIETNGGLFCTKYELSGSITGGEFLGHLTDY
jgi:hypothetical protein